MLYDPKREISTLLRHAANEVRMRGLAKHTQMDAGGRVCIHGAIRIAHNGEVNYVGNAIVKEADRRVAAYLNEVCGITDGVTYGGASYWNNKPQRTAEEVIAVLEGAASWR